MKRGQRPNAEQVVLTLRQTAVQSTQGKSIAVAQLRRRTSQSKATPTRA